MEDKFFPISEELLELGFVPQSFEEAYKVYNVFK